MPFKIFRILISVLISLIFALPQPVPQAKAEDDTFSATLVDFDGEVLIQKGEDETWLEVERDIPLEQGDRIKTGVESYADILIDDGSLLKLEENTELLLTELSADFETKRIESSISILIGRLLSNIASFTHYKSRFEVKTPTSIAAVRGTEFVVDATDTQDINIGVFDGELVVGGIDENGKLIEGSETVVATGNSTFVKKYKRPLPPSRIRGRMLLNKKKMQILRTNAVNRRLQLKRIIDKRPKAHKRIQQKWKTLKPVKPPKKPVNKPPPKNLPRKHKPPPKRPR